MLHTHKQVLRKLYDHRNWLAVSSRLISSTESATIEDKKLQYYKDLSKTVPNPRPPGWDEALPFEKVPGPKPVPLLGNTWRYIFGEFRGLDSTELMKMFKEKYGNVVTMSGIIGRKDMLLIFNEKDIETFHKNEGPWPYREVVPSIEYYRNVLRDDVFQGVSGLATMHGEKWFKMRTITNPIMMKTKNLYIYADQLDKITGQLIDNMRYFASLDKKREMPDDFHLELSKWSLELAGLITVDKEFGVLKRNVDKQSETSQLVFNTLRMFQLIEQLDMKPSLWKYVSTPTWRTYVKTLDFITNTSIKYVNDFIERLEKGEADPDTILGQLLKKDKKVAVAMALDTISAGVDTTAKGFANTLYHLAKHPEKQEELRKEARALLPNKDSPVTREVLTNSPYVKAVIKESFRITPVTSGNGRETIKDLVLGGYQIPKGTFVLTNFHLMFASDEHYARAKEFLPERWLPNTPEEISRKNTNPYIYLPFGYGPRSCIGRRLANVELEVGLLKIIRNFELEWPHADAKFKTTLLHGIADPLKLRIKEVEN